MSDTTGFCMFNLPVVYVYGSFSFDLDTICLVLVHINSTSGSKWPPFLKSPLTGQNCNFRFASIAYLFCHLENCLCAKFCDFNRKRTIQAHICSTITENLSFKSLVTLVNSQLVCLLPVGILNPVRPNKNKLLVSIPTRPLKMPPDQEKFLFYFFPHTFPLKII